LKLAEESRLRMIALARADSLTIYTDGGRAEEPNS